MTNDLPDVTPDDSDEKSGPPWTDPEIQHHIQWRDGDVVISVPPKSGTTWTMNIVHQLRAGGDPDLTDVYVEVPWLELVPKPGSTRSERIATFDGMPNHRRRAFKTHSSPGSFPFQSPGAGKDVRYVVVVRNPDEAVASLYPFIAAHSDAWFEMWGTPRAALERSDFETFFSEVAKPRVCNMIFGFVEAWWSHRHDENVMFLHFSEMKRDHEGSVRKIARFLDFNPTEKQWPKVLEYTSFPWMKDHQEKFEIQQAAGVPILESGGMVRKGKTGQTKDDGMTPAISAMIAELGGETVKDAAALEWCYRGGPLSD